jgi:tRNA dimethylallyltransferase
MDLGTGKDVAEYSHGGAFVPYHLIDIVDPAEEFNVFRYQELFHRSFREIAGRGKIPIMVGGTGLYLDAVMRGYRMHDVPENSALREELAGEDMASLRRRFLSLCGKAHNTTDILDRARLTRAIEIAAFSRGRNPDRTFPTAAILPLVIGIRCERDLLRKKITARLHSRIEAGMVEEVRRLHERGVGWDRIDSFGLEYRYIGLYLQGRMTPEEMFRTLNTRIHQFAKRQETWFRRMEKNGVEIHWLEGADEGAAIALISGLPA